MATPVAISCDDHPLPVACPVVVDVADHEDARPVGRTGTIVGVDVLAQEYLVSLGGGRCVTAAWSDVRWRLPVV